MSSGFFNVGVTGLNAAQAGLLTSSHNISNASTAGYNRQYIVQTTNTPQFTGAGFLGQGTNIQTVKRVYNDFLQKEVRIAETNVAELKVYGDQINQIDSLLADPSAGLSPVLQSFFTAADEAAANPASIPARQAMLSAAQSLSARFNSLDQQLTQIRDGANSQISNEIGTINSLVQQVRQINERIVVAQATSVTQPANDLLDQRDKLVADLNKEIKITVQTESDGTFSLFFGSGQPLLVGGQSYTLLAKTSAEDLAQMNVALKSPNGQVLTIPESLVNGGTLGGLLKFRSATLDTAQNYLGRVALAMATTINAQHRLGQDLDGNAGGDFFNALTPAVLGAPTNAGTATIGANITVSDYSVRYDGTNYNVTRLSDNTAFPPVTNMPLVIDGIKLSLAAGTPQAGDTFIVKPGALPNDRVTKLQSLSDAMLATTGSNLQTLGDSDFRLTVSGATAFSLTRLSDNTTWTASGVTQEQAIGELMKQIAPQGFSLSLNSGTASVGDSFLIRPTRYGARDMGVGVADPRDIALAQGFRTGAAPTNAGTGTISAGNVAKTDVPLTAPVKLTYDAASNSLIGFPVGSQVLVGTTVYNVSSNLQRIPYASGYNYSFNGVGFTLSGVLTNGDSFIVNPPRGGVPAGSNGLTALFGTPVAAGTTSTGSVAPATAAIPVNIVAGANDRFDISVDGGTKRTVTVAPGSYTASALVAQIQTQINAAIASQGTSVAVTLTGTNQIVVASNNGAGSVVMSESPPANITAGNNGLTALFGTPAAVVPASTGSVTPATATSPLAIVAGSNDKFDIAVDGGVAKTITLTAGSYTPATLILQIQAQLNATVGAGAVTASLDGTNHLVLTSNGGVPSVALSQTNPNLGTGVIAAGQVTTSSSMPSAPITLTYHQATIAGLPARLTGFPVGSTVTVAKPDGSVKEYSTNSTDGFTDAANFADYVDFTSGATISFNGMSFVVAGNPADGDTFNVGPNTSATGDNRNVLAISGLQLSNGLADGTATYQSSYSAMVSLVGNKTREIQVTLTAQENLVKQGENAVQSASGVNLDEEAANLMRYQQAYQAAAKMLDMSGKLFDLITALGR